MLTRVTLLCPQPKVAILKANLIETFLYELLSPLPIALWICATYSVLRSYLMLWVQERHQVSILEALSIILRASLNVLTEACHEFPLLLALKC